MRVKADDVREEDGEKEKEAMTIWDMAGRTHFSKAIHKGHEWQLSFHKDFLGKESISQ